VYKRAGLTKKKTENVSYVVAKRSKTKRGMGKRVSRPAGVKGRFKVVDPRMKKDDRTRKVSEKKNKKKGKKGKSSSNRTKR
jgi:AdoMet-dependent rRNA methyltransferase SPB1